MKRLLLWALLVTTAALVTLFALGARRYGGISGLIFRVRVEIAERRPASHPAQVPTPLPTPTPAPAVAPAQEPDPAHPVTPVVSFTATPSPSPTPTPTSAPEATSTPAVSLTPVQPAVALSGLHHNWQTWNNCGPATLAMHLSYFGSGLDQETIRRALRPNRNDKNTGPQELAAFARSQGLQALVRVHGSAALLRQFLSNGIPVLVETWIEPKPDDGLGHYRVLTGYDDARRVWIAYDSFISKGVRADEPYHGIAIPYDELTRGWKVFNDTYLLLYTPEQEPVVRAILGSDWDEQAMWERALADARMQVTATPDDAFAWFNLGTDLAALKRYEEAASAYDRARQLGLPWRMLWYQFGPFEAYVAVGRDAEALALADATLATTQDVEELYYWRARALSDLGDEAAARSALERALTLNPHFAAASP